MIRTYFITLFTSLLLVAVFNMWVDPSCRWHRNSDFSNRKLLKGEVWIFPEANWNERNVRLQQINLIDQPQILILGSSRSVFVDSRYFEQSLNVLNVGVSGATIEDSVIFWQKLKELGKEPKHVLLFIDPWIYNKNSGQIRWKENAPLLNHFRDEIPLTLFDHIVSFRDQMNDLLSARTLSASLDLLRNGTLSGQGSLALETTRPREKTGYRWDGSNFYTDLAVKPKSREEIKSIGIKYANEKEVWNLWNWEFDSQATDLLDQLINDVQHVGATMTLIVPPYQTDAYDGLVKRKNISEIFLNFTEMTERITKRHPGATFCNAMNPAVVKCEPTEFMDGMHALDPCIEKVMTYCSFNSENSRK